MRSETFDTPEAPELRINLPSGDIRVETSADVTQTYVELSGPNEDDARIEQAASAEGLSVNTWIVRALGRASSAPTTTARRSGRRLTGYAES